MSQVRTIVTLQVRRGTAAEWTSADPTLSAGEIGFETDTNKFKIGTGDTVWTDLNYANASSGGNVLDDYILTSARGSANGVASLDADGLVPASQLPASVKITVSSVADQTARLALTAEPGDIAIQVDTGTTYALSASPASTNSNWKELTNTAAITAAIDALDTDAIEEGTTNLYFTDARAIAALDPAIGSINTEISGINGSLEGKAPLASPGFSGIPTADTAAPGTNNNQLATTEYTDAAIAALIAGAPGALDTLNEIAAAINDDADYAGTITGVVSEISGALSDHSSAHSAHGSVGDIVGTASEQTLSNKSISGLNNTLSAIPQSAVTDLTTDLGLLAPKDSPTFTGTVVLPSTTSIGSLTDSVIAELAAVTATATELNTLDGITASTAELNVLDGITASTSELNILEGVTAAFSEINVLDGILSTTAELNILNGVTATSAEINTLDGILASTSDLNSLTGITGNVQEQLDDKANSADITEAAQDAVGNVVGHGLVYDDPTGTIQVDLETAGGLKFAALTNKVAADLDYVVDKTSVQTLTNKTLTSPKINEDVEVTATATELNVLDGITASTTELNLLDGVVASTAEINILGGLTATSAELNILDGALLDTTELNFVNGVTSSIQDQLDGKAPSDVIPAPSAPTSGKFLTNDGTDVSWGTVDLSSKQDVVSGVSSTEIGYLDGVTSSIQDQLDDKFNAADASTTYISEGVNLYFTDERAQDAVGNSVGTGLTYTDSTGEIKVTPDTYDAYGAASAVAGDLSTHVSDTTAHGTTGDVVGTSDTQTLTNKTLTSPKINEDVALTATATELNYVDGVTSNIQTQLDDKAPISSPTFTGTVSGITKSMVGLGNVDNTSDADKPVSTATQSALDLKAPLESPTFTGTVSGVTKSMVGLGNVDNTSDANKPVSTATQTALNLKAPLASPTFTGTVSAAGITSSGNVQIDGNLIVSGTTSTVNTATVTTRDNLIYLNADLDLTILDATHNTTTVEYQVSDNADIVVGMSVRVTGVTPSDYNIGYADAVTVVSKRTSGSNHYFTVTKTVTVTYTSGGIAHLRASANPDLGFAGGYYSGGYAHAGLFRDASDSGKFKFFQGYTPEPDESVNIDTTDASFALAPLAVASIEATSATIGDVSNTELQYLNGVTSAIQTQIDSKAPLASPTFTGTVTLPTGTVTSDMLLDGTIVNADINASAAIALSKLATDPLARANHTGTQLSSTISDFDEAAQDAIGNNVGTGLSYNDTTGAISVNTSTIQARVTGVSDTEIGYLDGVTSAIQTQLDAKLASSTASSTYAPLSGPTFTGTVVLPSTTSIGNVTSTEIGYVDGVTSSIQTQLDTKETRYYTFVTDTTTSRTIASSTDEGKTLKFTSSSAIAVTVPTAANDAGWAVGDYVELIQYGAGQITVAGAVGVTVNATDSQKKTRVQFSSLTLIKIDTNEWLLTGDTTA